MPAQLNTLNCSSQRLSDRNNNEALSTWTVVADDRLAPLFRAGEVTVSTATSLFRSY